MTAVNESLIWLLTASSGKKRNDNQLTKQKVVLVTHVYLLMIAGGFVLGVVTGWLLHRSDFCIAGMFRDLFLFRSTTMLKSLLLLIVVAMLLFELIRLSGLVSFPFPKYGIPTGTNVLGGFLFGTGMVLAGGCVLGTLYRLGAGSFPSLLAFIGLITGSTLYAELHPCWSTLAKALSLPTSAITLPELLSVPAWLMVMALLLFLLPLLWRWYGQGKLQKPVVVEGYLQPWQVAIGLALVSATFLLVIGLPMGITTSFSKLGAMLLQLVAPEYCATLVYFQKQSFQYVPSMGGGVVTGAPGPLLDGVALVQFPLISGILAGSAWSAISLGEWRMQFRLPLRQVLSALLGGVIMGLASRMTPSCNVWHMLGGLPVMGLQSILFIAGMLPGAWIGGILLTRLVVPR